MNKKRKLHYWVALDRNDEPMSIRGKTRREVIQKLTELGAVPRPGVPESRATWRLEGGSWFEAPVRCEIEYTDAFDLLCQIVEDEAADRAARSKR